MENWLLDTFVPDAMQTNGIFLLVVWVVLVAYTFWFPLRSSLNHLIVILNARKLANVAPSIRTTREFNSLVDQQVSRIRRDRFVSLVCALVVLALFCWCIHEVAVAVDRHW